MAQVRLGAPLVRTLQQIQSRDRQIITPAYESFLHRNPEIVYTPEVIEKVTASLLKRQTSRSGRLGASSAGSCLRAQVLSYLGAPGTPAGPDLRRIFEDGKWRHLRIQAALLQAGVIDRVEVPVRWARARASGDVDGAGVVPDDHPNESWRGLEFGLEIKGAMSFAFSAIEKDGPGRFFDQVSRYFLYTGFDLFVILVESKDTQRTVEYVVSEKEVNTGGQLIELQTLNDYIDDRQLPPMLPSCSILSGQKFKTCPYGGSVSNSCHQTPESW